MGNATCRNQTSQAISSARSIVAPLFFLFLALLLPPQSNAHEFPEESIPSPFEDTLEPASPLQKEYDRLSIQLRALERANTSKEKFRTIGTVIALDAALELVHTWIMSRYSPDYIYGRSLSLQSDVRDILSRFLIYSFRYGHIPALTFGLSAWFAENASGLPNLDSINSLYHIGAIATAFSVSYGVLFLRMRTQVGYHQQETPYWRSTVDLTKTLEIRDRIALAAVEQLDIGKHLLQAGAITALIGWGLIRRFKKDATIEDLRSSLVLARERLQRESREKRFKESQSQNLEDLLAQEL